MKTRSCLIIEDNEAFIDILKIYIKKLPFFQIAAVCNNYGEAIDFITSAPPLDLIFLDIELGNEDLSGMDILKTMPNLPPVIINTSHPDFAVESYQIGKAVDYLIKPFNFERFLLAVNRALQVNVGNDTIIDNDFIVLKKGRKFEKFEYSNIVYFEGYGIYAKVFTEQEVTHTINDTISALAGKLDKKHFVRVHKSFIINIEKIKGFDHNYIFLGAVKIPIGVSFKENLEGLLRLFDKKK